jgi:hypothetical protein
LLNRLVGLFRLRGFESLPPRKSLMVCPIFNVIERL